MKVLNLYAGIGGNRQLWEDVEITAVKNVDYIADAYEQMYPNDKVVREDAHQYLLEHYNEYDFVWSSPPCPTHSKLRMSHPDSVFYPDMKLYEEILFLKHFFRGHWVVENVTSYYGPLVVPTAVIDRHFFWSNFDISSAGRFARERDVSRETREQLSEYQGYRDWETDRKSVV